MSINILLAYALALTLGSLLLVRADPPNPTVQQWLDVASSPGYNSADPSATAWYPATQETTTYASVLTFICLQPSGNYWSIFAPVLSNGPVPLPWDTDVAVVEEQSCGTGIPIWAVFGIGAQDVDKQDCLGMKSTGQPWLLNDSTKIWEHKNLEDFPNAVSAPGIIGLPDPNNLPNAGQAGPNDRCNWKGHMGDLWGMNWPKPGNPTS